MSDLPLYSALGCAVSLDTAGRTSQDVERVAMAWQGAVVRGDDPPPARHISVGVPEGPIELALARLSPGVTLRSIEARRGEIWMLHAGAVADDAGRVVAVIGPSGRGKTTASRALAERYAYVTDETLGVDAGGVVLPFRKPLSIIDRADGEKLQRSPDELALGALPPGPLRLAGLVILDREPGRQSPAVLTRADLGDVLPELVEQSSYLADLPRPLRTIAAHVEAVGGVHRIVYGDAAELPDALAPLFTDPAQPEVRAQPARAFPVAGDGSVRWYRGAHLDAALLEPRRSGGEPRLSLLQPDTAGGATLRILDGIGPTIWREASGVAGEVIADAVVARHGLPEQIPATTALDQALSALRDEGVLAHAPAWRIRSDVAWTGDAGSYVALPLSGHGTPQPLTLAGSAGLIWHVVARARGATVEALVDAVSAGTGVAPDVVAPDLASFLESLRAQDLVERFVP